MTENLHITCPDFAPEEWIPDRLAGYGADESPELHIEGIAAGAVSMAVTLDDLGHPLQPGYNHWVAWDIPPTSVLPGRLPKGAVVEQPIHLRQGRAYGKHCYRGPKPPFNWNHRYCFTVYTLDAAPMIPPDADKAAVLQALAGHILQTGHLYGKYQRKHS